MVEEKKENKRERQEENTFSKQKTEIFILWVAFSKQIRNATILQANNFFPALP
jgi:hypothetical protein